MMNDKRSAGIRSTSSFCAHRLVFSQDKVVVKATAGNYIFFSVFALMGLSFAVIPWFAEGEQSARIGISLFGLFFAGIGFAGMFWKHNRMPEIDLLRRMFYPERRKHDPTGVIDIASLNSGIPLSDLERIQVSSRHVSGRKSSYTAYMLDLVFKDGYSCRLLSHGGYRQFVEDAEHLSKVLNMPLTGMSGFQHRSVSRAASGAGGVISIIFSIFWLSVCCSMFSEMLLPGLKKIGTVKEHPEVLIQLIFPSIFILVGVGLFISGVRTLLKSLKKPQK